MLSSPVTLEAPVLSVIGTPELRSRLEEEYKEPLAWVRMGYTGELNGTVELVLKSAEAAHLAAVLSEDLHPDNDLDAVRSAMISEVGNVVINAVIGTLSNSLGLHLRFTVPQFMEGEVDSLLTGLEDPELPKVLLVRTRFYVQTLDIEGHILLYFSLATFREFRSHVKRYGNLGSE
jgi:chemotaxis protein CheC